MEIYECICWLVGWVRDMQRCELLLGRANESEDCLVLDDSEAS